MFNEINTLLTNAESTINKNNTNRKEILEQILRCEYLLNYIQKAEQLNHISKAQKLHSEIQVLSLIASLEKILKGTFSKSTEFSPDVSGKINPISTHRER